jgi:hypothetical protein
MNTQHIDPAKESLSLHPLEESGPDAMDTHDTPHLAHASLCALQIAWQNTEYGITAKKGADLLHTGASNTDFVPKDATLTEATFEVKFDDCPSTHKLIIHPPADLTFEFPSDEPRITPWLDKRHFRIPKRILQTCAAFLLAVVSAIAPALDDDDGDEDDFSSDHHYSRA